MCFIINNINLFLMVKYLLRICQLFESVALMHDLKLFHSLWLSSNLICNMHYYNNSNTYFANLQISNTFISIHDLLCRFCQPADNVHRTDILQNSSIGCSWQKMAKTLMECEVHIHIWEAWHQRSNQTMQNMFFLPSFCCHI